MQVFLPCILPSPPTSVRISFFTFTLQLFNRYWYNCEFSYPWIPILDGIGFHRFFKKRPKLNENYIFSKQTNETNIFNNPRPPQAWEPHPLYNPKITCDVVHVYGRVGIGGQCKIIVPIGAKYVLEVSCQCLAIT